MFFLLLLLDYSCTVVTDDVYSSSNWMIHAMLFFTRCCTFVSGLSIHFVLVWIFYVGISLCFGILLLHDLFIALADLCLADNKLLILFYSKMFALLILNVSYFVAATIRVLFVFFVLHDWCTVVTACFLYGGNVVILELFNCFKTEVSIGFSSTMTDFETCKLVLNY